jgi:hypothetical protein
MTASSSPQPQELRPSSDWEEVPFYLHGVGRVWRIPLLARLCFARMVPGILLHKLKRRLAPAAPGFTPAAVYNQLLVFDRPELAGGGLVYAPDFLRLLLEMGLGRQEHICEFASGAGYIGYYLLAHGFCRRVTFLDINPVAIEAANYTARMNSILERISAYVSDGVDQVPQQERWNVVVANPPQLPSSDPHQNVLLTVDPDWNLHRRFYGSIARYMVPGGYVVMIERGPAPEHSLFREMIEAGGGQFVRAVTRVSVAGVPSHYHYVISRW